jgi:hypothetical protein
MAKLLTTDVINGALFYMLTKQTMDEYLTNNPIEDEELLERFKTFWVALEQEMAETKLEPGVSWDIPSDW